MQVEVKINNHFLEFAHDYNHDQYILIGGYGSGKSYTTALKIILLALREKRKILVVRDVKDTIKESCFEDLIEAIATLKLNNYFVSKISPLEIKCINGSRIIFRGLDKTSKIKSIKDIDTVWIEEASEISLNAYKELKKRLRTDKLKTYLFMSTNPAEPSHWIAELIEKYTTLDNLYQDKTISVDNINKEYTEKLFFHHSTYRDNKFLPKSFTSDLQNEENYYWRTIGTDGKFGSVGEKVFNNITELSIDQIQLATKNGFAYVGYDFGFVTSYNSIIYCYIDTERNNLYITKEFYRNRMTDEEMLQEPIIQDLINDGDVVFGDSAEPKTIEFYRNNGVRMNPAEKTANNNMNGVKKMWTFNNIYINKDLTPNAYRELMELKFHLNDDGVVAKNSKTGKIFNIDSHTFDAINYALTQYKPRRVDKHRYKGDENV